MFSIYKKMRDKHLTFSEIMDIYAFRIVVENIDTCYRVLGIMHNLYKPIPKRFKDYIAIPKANGYQSLHSVLFGPFGVPIEIQIRTKEMDRVAESGIAAIETEIGNNLRRAQQRGEASASLEVEHAARRIQLNIMGLRSFACRPGANESVALMAHDIASEIRKLKQVPS